MHSFTHRTEAKAERYLGPSQQCIKSIHSALTTNQAYTYVVELRTCDQVCHVPIHTGVADIQCRSGTQR